MERGTHGERGWGHGERGGGDTETGGGKHGKRRDREHKEKQMPTGTSCTMLGDTILMGD